MLSPRCLRSISTNESAAIPAWLRKRSSKGSSVWPDSEAVLEFWAVSLSKPSGSTISSGKVSGLSPSRRRNLSSKDRCSAVVWANSTPIPLSGCITRTTPSDRSSTPAARIESVTRVETGNGEVISR